MPWPGRQSNGPRSQLRELDDQELMNLVGKSDAGAFEIILERHSNAAFSLAYHITESRSLAEVAVQEAFHSVWRNRSRYDHTRDSMPNSMLRNVRDRAIDLLRRDRAPGFGSASDRELLGRAKAPERTDEDEQQRESADRLRAALDRLPAEQSQMIELAYFGGFTHTEIAAMLDLPADAVKGRMRLGLERLRTQLLGQEAVT